ncbi:ATP-binding cassette domain-containing protein [Brochothrix thermosphacta]|nr:ATP-binding cassette domain-containing protein [Brochothrix thermosphacta]MDO7864057.1 ATP-binding cassette domain-containing protein [Brochothrix thermosphacta]
MLEIKNLSYRYKEQEILKNVSYIFETGKIYAIVGESGVGKSTFLSLISGLEFYSKVRFTIKTRKSQIIPNTDEVSVIFFKHSILYRIYQQLIISKSR